jgi:hypothetical protein
VVFAVIYKTLSNYVNHIVDDAEVTAASLLKMKVGSALQTDHV